MPKVPSKIKSDFREIARRIVSEDRAAKRYGYSQNTVGAITQALERAYKDGLVFANKPIPKTEDRNSFIRWEEIPPTSRDVLFSISSQINIDNNLQKAGANILVLVPSDAATLRWAQLSCVGTENPHLFAQKGIGPLLRLGILAPTDETGTQQKLTKKGLATITEFRRRWDEHDPTLPLMSLGR